jgi:hypothetical protein
VGLAATIVATRGGWRGRRHPAALRQHQEKGEQSQQENGAKKLVHNKKAEGKYANFDERVPPFPNAKKTGRVADCCIC